MSHSNYSIQTFDKNDKKNIEKGQKILKENKFFQDFTGLMRNKEFRNFYENYFKDWSDIQTMIFYMKIYSTVEDLYFNQYQKEISDELMTYTLHKIITTNETRKVAVELFRGFKGEKTEKIDQNKLSILNSLIDFDNNSKNILLIKN